MAAVVETEPGPLPRRDLVTIALIGLAHACSHFFQLVLPALFPILVGYFHASYAELGLATTAFFVASGIGQPLAGLLVDRFGARRVLFLGLGLYVLAVLALSTATSLVMLYPTMALAGLGNCVFHPADYTVLTASVRRTHLGRAYSMHTLGGNLGWAAAPALVLPIAHWFGWRTALASAAAVGAVIWIALWLNRGLLRDDHEDEAPADRARPATPSSLALLRAPAVPLCFSYFLLLAGALIAVQNFLPPILGALYGTPLMLGAAALTAFLLGASTGVVAGGIVADRNENHAGVIAGGLAGAGLLFLALAQVAIPGALLVGVLFVAGFLSGLTTPSRDMLVRSATPRGATGRVFGFVYSGLDAGSAIVPAVVGALIDHGHARWALWGVAGMLFVAIATAVSVRGAGPKPVAAVQ